MNTSELTTVQTAKHSLKSAKDKQLKNKCRKIVQQIVIYLFAF